VKITEGIHRLGPGLVNVYLVEEAGAVTIVDAGMPGDWSDLLKELAAMGRSLDDVRALVLTHGHSDHIGFAERARRERGWTPKVHELDAALARGEVPNPAKGGGPTKPLPLLRFILLGLRRGGLRPPKIQEVATYGDGATLDVPGSPRVILLPGHTPGSAALHVASRDADMGKPARARDIDALADRSNPGRARIGNDHPGRAEDREAAQNAEPPVRGPLGDFRVAADAAIRALEDFAKGAMHFELLGIKHVRAFDSNLLIVSVSLREDSQLTRLVGCYLAETDTRRGAAMAVPNATNRVLGNHLATR